MQKITFIERGNKTIKFEVLQKVATVFDCPIEDIMSKEQTKKPSDSRSAICYILRYRFMMQIKEIMHITQMSESGVRKAIERAAGFCKYDKEYREKIVKCDTVIPSLIS